MTTVIYHAGCVDGFTAAWCCWRRFGDAARYVAAQYGEAPPDCAGEDVVIVDFSYPREVLESLSRTTASLLVLDHHKSAQSALEGLPYCKFDMSRSGAGMAWDELRSDARPELVNYVEDRDLWRWALPNSKEVSAYIGTVPRTFSDWSQLRIDLELKLLACVEAGSAVLRSIDGYVEFLSKQSRQVGIGGHSVPCINTTYAASELIGKLAELNSDAPFAAGWFQRQDGLFVYSLRSRGDFDVSQVAKQYGGGGHKNAAGFTVGALL
ncbi:MAG TPA: DHHA1 domain-containing protein [Polyangiaceae bacterium]|nr:DHHA1 domain-containing protein [Polyangiaceae bacterium]